MTTRVFREEKKKQEQKQKKKQTVDRKNIDIVRHLSVVTSVFKEVPSVIKSVSSVFEKRSLVFKKRYLFVIIALFALSIFAMSFEEDGNCGDGPVTFKVDRSFRYFSNYKKEFNDLNPTQMRAAKANGLKPMDDFEDIKLHMSGLEEISDCRYYVVDELTHSFPYLVPKAAKLLDDIGENFRDSLDAKDIPDCKLIVTSLLRTKSSVKSLRKSNVNASENSTHMYGTTFDITYARYIKGKGVHPEVYKTVLAQVLRDLKKSERCFVKYEAKQACFHITVR